MNTEARFLHSQKMTEAVALGATVKEIRDNGETGDQKVVFVEFNEAEGIYVIDNANAQWGNYTMDEAMDAFNAGEIELNPVTRFERDGDEITSFNC